MRSTDHTRGHARAQRGLWWFPALLIIVLGATQPPRTTAGASFTFKGEVTWVKGAGVKVGKRSLHARGGQGFKSLNNKDYVLHPGDQIKATGESFAQFYVEVGGSRAYCQTDPARGVVQVNPSGTVLLTFRDGDSTCGALVGSRGCMQVGKDASVSFRLPSAASSACSAPSSFYSSRSSISSSAASRPASPPPFSAPVLFTSRLAKGGSVFKIQVNEQRSLVRVQTGALVVSAKGGQKRAVVIGADSQTVVPTGNEPSPVSGANALPTQPGSVVRQVEAPLPNVIKPPRPGQPLLAGPSNPTSLRRARFTFAIIQNNVTFSCAIDGSDFRLCTSPYEVTADSKGQPLQPGSHDFAVKATDEAGQTGPPRHYHWTIDNSKIVFAYKDNGGYQIYTMNADGTDPTNLSGPMNTHDYAPALSPDGQTVAFQRQDGAGNVNLFVMSINGGPARQLTDQRFAANPAWSPDGTRIVFESTETGHSELYEKNISDGPGVQAKQLTFDNAIATRPSWSKNNQIAFASRSGPNAPYQLYLISAGGGQETPVMQTNCGCNELDPAWSKDGTQLAFDSRRDQQASRIYTIDLATHQITAITTSQAGATDQTQDSNPSWAPDGRSLVFQRLANDFNSIYVTGPDDGNQLTRITETDALPNESLVPSW